MPDSTPASTHTAALTPSTLTRSVRARSGLSAEARTAIPRRVQLRNAASRRQASTAAPAVSTSPVPKTRPSIVTESWKGAAVPETLAPPVKRPNWSREMNSWGTCASSQARTCASPIVATVRTRRGARSNRRRIA
jgi:hypothetical protein